MRKYPGEKQPLIKRIIYGITHNDVHYLRKLADKVQPADIAELTNYLELTQLIYLIRILRVQQASEIFADLTLEKQKELINSLTRDEIKQTLTTLYASEVVELLEDLPQNLVIKILQSTDKEMRKEINQILNYPRESAGSYVRLKFLAFNQNEKVTKAVKRVKTAND